MLPYGGKALQPAWKAMSIRGSYRQVGVPINHGYRYLGERDERIYGLTTKDPTQFH
jgi:hypothetical protein